MTLFRPCIDLHEGKVKQIVGGSLKDDSAADPLENPPKLIENFVSPDSAAHFARLYAKDNLRGGHVIKLGAGNDEAAREALDAFPGGLQIGGGITSDNAAQWLDAGASHVIVTSWLFSPIGEFHYDKLKLLAQKIGRQRIVVDLSCKRMHSHWQVVMNRWQTITHLTIDYPTLDSLAIYCDQFLIHAADVEGLCQGIDQELVRLLGTWNRCPITYAGGINCLEDIQSIDDLSQGAMDVTVGSALDLFGGKGITYQQLLAWNASRTPN